MACHTLSPNPQLPQPPKTAIKKLVHNLCIKTRRNNCNASVGRNLIVHRRRRFGAHVNTIRDHGETQKGRATQASFLRHFTFQTSRPTLLSVTGLLSKRLFPLLQLTRMALVFTAISNSLCTVLLVTRHRLGSHGIAIQSISWKQALTLAIVSTGLYGYGMSLNDIIDRRRDATLAANRPLPSGRISVTAAHLVCAMLLFLAVFATAAYARLTHRGWEPVTMVIGTAILITFYDLAGKYLVALGLVTLGLIRFFHAIIPAPEVPVLWHPLVLLNHTAILSLVAYRWELKRPLLTKLHLWMVLGLLALIDVALVVLEMGEGFWQQAPRGGLSLARLLNLRLALVLPLAAAVVFVFIAWRIRRRRDTRIAGQMIMLYGLLWLIVYDVTFAASYVDLPSAGVLLMLLPMAYGAVQAMRWWGRVAALSQRPDFKRAEQ